MTLSYESEFATRSDLQRFGSNALALFALDFRFQIEDLHSVAANSVTDGTDDKKADLIYIDPDAGCAVIAQSYIRESPGSNDIAPANKASDLNTAAGWLLSRPLDDLPKLLRPKADELRTALKAESLTSIHFWYVHNMSEGQQVRDELKTVELTARNAIDANFPGCGVSVITAREVGRDTLEEWYRASTTPILVSESFSLPISGAFEQLGKEWKAIVTAVPAGQVSIGV